MSMNPSSLAILGRQPALGLAELESLYSSNRVRPVGRQAAWLDLEACLVDFPRLGGTIKLCKVLATLDTVQWKDVEHFLLDVSPAHSEHMPAGKMHLGLSAYDLPVAPAQLLATGLKLKKAIQKKTGRSVRLVPNKTPELNAAQVLHNKLTDANGWELVLVRDGTRLLVAQTVAVQDIDSYTVRDRSRPKRDPRVGMLPPKLAQQLINLAVGPDEFNAIKDKLTAGMCLSAEDTAKIHAGRAGKTLLDPFCGTGVILQEALLMGYDVIGTDLEPRMVDYTRRNLEWLSDSHRYSGSVRYLEAADATVHAWAESTSIAMVASETYLGRPFTSPPGPEVLAQTVAECNLIIKKFLQNIRTRLEPGRRLALGVPAWQTRPSSFRHLPLIDQLSELGYNRIRFAHVRDEDLLYYRADQIVARELLVMTRK